MDVTSFCRQSRTVIVAGKGGVGKSTITAALARMAADAGLSVLVVDLEGKPGMATAFGGAGPLHYDQRVLAAADGNTGEVRARRITPDDALLQYLGDHGMRRMSKRLVSAGVIDLVSTAIPGIRDILVLGRVKQLERDDPADVIVVDAPATGHAMTFLSSARGLLDAARSGPVRSQAAEVVELLSDPSRSQVVLVTLPEEMPVSEVVEAAFQLEDRVGVTLGPVVVNACLDGAPWLDADPAAAAAEAGVHLAPGQADALRAAAAFHAERQRLQDGQLERLAAELPLPQLRTPVIFEPAVGPAELQRLADALAAGIVRLDGPE